MRLINALKQIQEAHRYRDSDMAMKLDISRVHWNNIKHCKAKIGITLLNRIKESYPELSKDVDFYLLNDYTRVNQQDTQR